MLSNAKRVYALHTVELRAKSWYFWPTYGDKNQVTGPYSSDASVSLMIALGLKREVKKRDSVHALPA